MAQATVATTVTGLQGHPIAVTAPTGNQALVWNGTAWAPSGPYMSVTGGAFTGAVTLVGNAAAALQPVTLQQLQAGYLPLAGGTLSGSLTVGGNINTNGLQAGGIGCTTVTATNNIQASNYVSTGTGILYSGISGNNNMGWSWNGGLGIVNAFVDGSFVGGLTPTGSDPRLKSNITTVSVDPLSVVSKIQMQQFDMQGLGPGAVSTHWDIGFMGDQLGTVIPNAVAPGDGEKTYDIVNILPLMAYVVGAIQALGTRVAALDGKPL